MTTATLYERGKVVDRDDSKTSDLKFIANVEGVNGKSSFTQNGIVFSLEHQESPTHRATVELTSDEGSSLINVGVGKLVEFKLGGKEYVVIHRGPSKEK